ncbi:hypothetical protein [Streptomyces sp. 8N706]|uniref:hypothetical protein n=1 Tax=Streptomyces sp. 8N706 TaxID=3457416 RepID=UPI003FD2C938
MSESIPEPPPVIVRGPEPGDPPFRVVQIGGTTVGKAHSIADVIAFARHAGVEHPDLEDPAVVRWVNGDMYTWSP